MKVTAIIALSTCLMLTGITCDDNPAKPIDQQQPQPPFEDAEAELMAVYVSGNLRAPYDLYQTIHADIDTVRSQWVDSLSVWDDCLSCPTFDTPLFYPVWIPSKTKLRITDSLRKAIQLGSSTQWQTLMDSLRFDSAYWRQSPLDSNIWSLTLYFEGRQHAARLAEHFVGFPGVRRVGPAGGRLGGRTEFIPAFTESTRGYIYYFGWGDCFSGCMSRRTVYFEMQDDSAIHIGNYEREVDGDDPPQWWTERVYPTLERFFDDYITWEDTTGSG